MTVNEKLKQHKKKQKKSLEINYCITTEAPSFNRYRSRVGISYFKGEVWDGLKLISSPHYSMNTRGRREYQSMLCRCLFIRELKRLSVCNIIPSNEM